MVIAKSKKFKPTMNSSTHTIKSSDINWSSGQDPPNNQDVGVPRAVFIPHLNSHPFEERHITLEQPVKIGRNVYRAAPSPSNAIFECRVLSRHHATVYYDKGHFYLVDNQSSNGTLINSNRCTMSKESEPYEVFSGDVVQFGIPVVENAGNADMNTFLPVVALLKLYHPDGKEAKLTFNPNLKTPLHLKELYQLNNFVQEAVQREASLESRLRTLRECVERTRAEAQASWELFVGEQRLLMRVHTLETMLSVGKQPDQTHVAQLLNDKRNYQEVAQESLRAAHEQRLALEESLERRGREAAALHQQNCALRLAANNALAELQKLAGRCESKMCAARVAIAAAEAREQQLRDHLPLTCSIQNGEAKMLVVSSDGCNKLELGKRGSLEDAVRALPDYIKLLLPQHLLSKIGIKSISAESKSPKEFELILKKNNLCEIKDNKTESEEVEEVGGSAEEKPTPESCTDDEKLRLNHEPGNENEQSSPLDGELLEDNNANSTYNDSENREDSPSKAGVEYANILRVMAGLNEEIKALRERLAGVTHESEQLRSVRDELLAAQPDPPRPDHADLDAFRANIADLQAQLSRANAAEEANMAEIQRLSSSSAALQAELAMRPHGAELEQLAALAASLQPPPRRDQACETEPELDAGAISQEIDEMFRLDEDDEEEDTSSVATERAARDEAVALLQEELVRAKERWAAESEARAALAARLSERHKHGVLPAFALLLLPVAAAVLLYLLLPQLS